jgi:hypothetical protein
MPPARHDNDLFVIAVRTGRFIPAARVQVSLSDLISNCAEDPRPVREAALGWFAWIFLLAQAGDFGMSSLSPLPSQ